MNILGVSTCRRDSGACLLQDGCIRAAAQERDLTGNKKDLSFPVHSLKYCLKEGKVDMDDLDFIAFCDKPFAQGQRILETCLAQAPVGRGAFFKAMSQWITSQLRSRQLVNDTGFKGEILFSGRHESIAAAVFFSSPFQEAAFLTLDEGGERATTSYGLGFYNNVSVLAELFSPHSLGLLYSAFVHYTGFEGDSAGKKFMELASVGEPKYKKMILSQLMDFKGDGSFRLNMKYFNYRADLSMTGNRFDELFGRPNRRPESPLDRLDMDLARSIQEVVEEVVLRMARHLHRKTGQKKLCVAANADLNYVVKNKILADSAFDEIYMQSMAADVGGALGAALFTWHQYLGKSKSVDMKNLFGQGFYLGPEFSYC